MLFRSEGGRPVAVQGIARDVGERRRTEEALEQIVRGTSTVTGDDFFRSLARHLASVLDVERPAGGFYLWQKIPGDDVAFTAGLFETQNITIVPGSYLARDTTTGNPGAGRVRLSLVAGVDECVEAAHRIVAYSRSL